MEIYKKTVRPKTLSANQRKSYGETNLGVSTRELTGKYKVYHKTGIANK